METIVFATLVLQVTDFLKELIHLKENASAVLTQAAAWVGGVILVVLAAHASATADIVLPGVNEALGTLDGASQVLVGLLAASVGSTIVDLKQAFDNTDTASKPPLIGPPAPPAV